MTVPVYVSFEFDAEDSTIGAHSDRLDCGGV